MAYTVIVKQEAVNDGIDAYEYYEKKKAGLGERFLEALDRRYLDYPYILRTTVSLKRMT